ncbi:hypothetical protein DZF92_14330, partial [Clavibacter michiganensis subsp. insidiosus]
LDGARAAGTAGGGRGVCGIRIGLSYGRDPVRRRIRLVPRRSPRGRDPSRCRMRTRGRGMREEGS